MTHLGRHRYYARRPRARRALDRSSRLALDHGICGRQGDCGYCHAYGSRTAGPPADASGGPLARRRRGRARRHGVLTGGHRLAIPDASTARARSRDGPSPSTRTRLGEDCPVIKIGSASLNRRSASRARSSGAPRSRPAARVLGLSLPTRSRRPRWRWRSAGNARGASGRIRARSWSRRWFWGRRQEAAAGPAVQELAPSAALSWPAPRKRESTRPLRGEVRVLREAGCPNDSWSHHTGRSRSVRQAMRSPGHQAAKV